MNIKTDRWVMAEDIPLTEKHKLIMLLKFAGLECSHATEYVWGVKSGPSHLGIYNDKNPQMVRVEYVGKDTTLLKGVRGSITYKKLQAELIKLLKYETQTQI